MSGEQKSVDVKKQLQELMSLVEKKAAYYGQKTYVSGDDVFYVVREFFLGLHDKSYEATYEDLISELKANNAIVFLSDEQREKSIQFLQELSEIQYSGRNSSAEQFKEYLSSFADLARELTATHDTSLDELIFSGLASVKQNDHSAAKKKYRQARDKYESLPENEQHRYYQGLQQLYSSLN